MTREEIIQGLQFTIDMFLSDPLTGEALEKPRNDMDKTTIDACKGAIELLTQESCENAINIQAAIDIVRHECGEWKGLAKEIVKQFNGLPPVQPKYNPDEWCKTCKEYDHDKHCCPRYNGVIRKAVEEMKQEPKTGWIPVSEKLPEDRREVLVTAYWHETYQVMMASYYGDGLWWCVPFNNTGKHEQKLKPKAWSPLPEPYEPQESEEKE